MTKNKKQEVYKSLQEKIINHELKPKEKLSEKELMLEYDIGRTPLRDVLTKLKYEYLIETIPQSGTFVKEFDLLELKEVLEMRIPLELLACELIIERISDKELNDIHFILNTLSKEMNQLSKNEVKNYTDEIHNIYYLASGNKRLTKSLKELHNFTSRAWYSFELKKESKKNSVDEWSNIIKMVEQKEVQKLKESIKNHIINFANSLNIECLQN